MTGTEAISNGVGAFKAPELEERRDDARLDGGDPRRVLHRHELCSRGISRSCRRRRETVLSQLGRHIFGGGVLYFALQYATFAILVLAANTAFADFPRLSSILARDRLHAAAVRRARRSARVLERHHRARGRGDAARRGCSAATRAR